MNITGQGETASYIVTSLKKDDRLAKAIARDFVDGVDLQALASYLVPSDVAVELLMKRLQNDPAATLADLNRLAAGKTVRATRKAKAKRPGRKPARGRKAAAKPKAPARKKAKGGKAGGARKRMSPAQAQEVKQKIIDFLAKNPWASRRQIADVAGLTSMAVYTRLIGELRDGKKVISRGTKAKMVYALTGAKVPAAAKAKKAAPKKVAAKKKAAPKKVAAKKAAPKKVAAKKVAAKKVAAKKVAAKK